MLNVKNKYMNKERNLCAKNETRNSVRKNIIYIATIIAKPIEDEFPWWVYFFLFIFFQNRQIHYFLKAIR